MKWGLCRKVPKPSIMYSTTPRTKNILASKNDNMRDLYPIRPDDNSECFSRGVRLAPPLHGRLALSTNHIVASIWDRDRGYHQTSLCWRGLSMQVTLTGWHNASIASSKLASIRMPASPSSPIHLLILFSLSCAYTSANAHLA